MQASFRCAHVVSATAIWAMQAKAETQRRKRFEAMIQSWEAKSCCCCLLDRLQWGVMLSDSQISCGIIRYGKSSYEGQEDERVGGMIKIWEVKSFPSLIGVKEMQCSVTDWQPDYLKHDLVRTELWIPRIPRDFGGTVTFVFYHSASTYYLC